ncbi:hypothetical protein Nmel_005017, partial [Mimus melanotis]
FSVLPSPGRRKLRKRSQRENLGGRSREPPRGAAAAEEPAPAPALPPQPRESSAAVPGQGWGRDGVRPCPGSRIPSHRPGGSGCPRSLPQVLALTGVTLPAALLSLLGSGSVLAVTSWQGRCCHIQVSVAGSRLSPL